MNSKYCLMFDFGGVIANNNVLVPGMSDVIKKSSVVFNLVIITSMYGETVKQFLRDHGLERYFLEIMGYDVSPSKAEKILIAISENSFDRDKCVLITDTVGDIREAHEAGIKAVAVTWGLTDPKDLTDVKPEGVIDSPDQIIPVVKKVILID